LKFVLIGAGSEIAAEFMKLCKENNIDFFTVSRNKINEDLSNNNLIISDYIDSKKSISRFINNIENPTVIFFNGALFENRPLLHPSKNEIEITKVVNYDIPYTLTKYLKEKNDINKFIYLSSIAAVVPRPKNYIYGSFKRKLEDDVVKLNLDNYLFVRFGKVFTKMSINHRTPPFSLEPHQAGKIILKKVNNRGVVYGNFGLFVMGSILKLIPRKIISRINL
jgi:hypothetical protein